MTEKRFKITKSKLVENAYVIEDKKKQFTFPTLVGDNRGLIAYEKSLNKLSEENEQLKQTISEVKNDEKQLSISFMDYKMQLIEVLQQNYNYAYSQRQKNLDKSIVAKTYEVLAQTVWHIAETMNVDIERFPRDGDVE